MHTYKDTRKKECFAVNLSDSELTTVCLDSKASLAVPHAMQLITRLSCYLYDNVYMKALNARIISFNIAFFINTVQLRNMSAN